MRQIALLLGLAALASTASAQLRIPPIIQRVIPGARPQAPVLVGIDALRAELSRLDVETEVRQDVVPDVAEAVLQVSAESSASLIVVGVRPRSPVGKLLLGSVAQRIILDATCPVLAVKPDGADGLA